MLKQIFNAIKSNVIEPLRFVFEYSNRLFEQNKNAQIPIVILIIETKQMSFMLSLMWVDPIKHEATVSRTSVCQTLNSFVRYYTSSAAHVIALAFSIPLSTISVHTVQCDKYTESRGSVHTAVELVAAESAKHTQPITRIHSQSQFGNRLFNHTAEMDKHVWWACVCLCVRYFVSTL